MLRRCLLLFFFVGILSFPAIGHAQGSASPTDDSAATADAAVPEEAPDPALRRSMDQPMFADLITHWRRCLHDYQSRKYADLLVDLGKLKGLKANTGVANLTPIARALLRMSLEMAEDPENKDLAPKLAVHAQAMAPDVPCTYLVSAQLSSGAGGEFSLGGTLKAFSQTVLSSLRYLPSLLDEVSRIAFIWFLLTLLAAALFSFALLFRYSKLLAHDVGHLLPSGASEGQKLILILLLLFVPFLLDLGVVILFLIWWFFLWAYANRNERVAAMVLLALMMSWPFAGKMFAAGVTPPDALEVTLARCNHEVCSLEDLDRLQGLRVSGKGNLEVEYALALASYRAGAFDPLELDEALVHLSSLVKPRSSPLRAKALVLQANIYFAKGVMRCTADQGNLTAGAHEIQEADNLYRQALEAEENVEGLYNRGRLLFYRDLSSDGDQLILKASELDAHRILEVEEVSQFAGQQEFLCGENFNHNRELLTPLMPAQDFFAATVRRQPTETLLGFHHQLLGPLPLKRVPLIAGVLAAVLIVMGLILRRFRTSSHCVRCGAVSDPKDRPELAQSGICETCLFYRIRGSFVDPKEIWRREKGIEIRQRMRKRMERGISFVLPGAGQMVRGKPVRGVLFFCCFFLPVLAIIVSDPMLGNLPGLERDVGMPTVQVMAFSLGSLVVYLLALLDIYSRD